MDPWEADKMPSMVLYLQLDDFVIVLQLNIINRYPSNTKEVHLSLLNVIEAPIVRTPLSTVALGGSLKKTHDIMTQKTDEHILIPISCKRRND